MPTGQYPFIDIAVHEKIREPFAAGDAVVVLSQSLKDVLWVNGAGARLFGHAGLYDFMDAGLGASTAAFRQIEAAAGRLLDIAEKPPQRFVMRTGSGFRRPLLPATMERIRLADGHHALLLSASVADPAATPEDQAAAIIDGFEEMDTHAAVLDRNGTVLRATASFGRLNMDSAARAQIVRDVAGEADRLVKHPVRTALGYLPAAIARITDDIHLLIAVEMSIGNLDPAPQDHPEPDHRTAAPTVNPGEAPPPTPSVLSLAPARKTMDQRPADGDVIAQPGETPDEQDRPAAPGSADGQDSKEATEDRIGRADVSEPPQNTGDQSKPPAPESFIFNPRRRPLRFVWKIDAEGVFREISPEFAQTVGPNAADIEGRRFSDVAQVFNVDPDHTITDLLRRRDTWSGKTVLWPVQGTDLRVPVDLAALPTYSRDREFDGFRGFGIVRSGDAQSDPEKIGLALANNPISADTAILDRPPADTEQTDTQDGDDPATEPEDAAADAGTGPAANDTEPDDRKDMDQDEKPALDITESPGRRQSDKIIRLEERRTKPRDGLSTSEKQAFHEIAQRLGQTPDKDTQDPPAVFGKRPTPPLPAGDDDPDAAGTPDPASAETGDAPKDVEASGPAGTAGAPDSEDDGKATDRRQPASRETAVTPELLETLPVPIIVHDGTTIFHINEEFRLLTGYRSTVQLNGAGGLAALFGGQKTATEAAEMATGAGTLALHPAEGPAVSVRARLRSVAWQDGRALLLALSQPAPADREGDVDSEPADRPASDDDQQDAAGRASALQVEVDELRSILETATDGVVLIDDEGIIRSMNRSASALFDYDEDEARGRPFAMLFAHESQRAVQDYLGGLNGNAVASVLNDGREVIGREASGGFLPLFMTIGHLSRSNGYCAVMRDITQWKRAEEELRAAKRQAETANSHKSEFLARVSHEIRTPLNAIIGFSELMAEERFGPIGSPRYVEYAHDIGRSGKHVLDIVNDLLDISKIEAGEQELDFQAVSLNQTLLDAVSILQPQANSQRVIIRTSLSSSVPDVVADQRSIKQIAINILSNAIRFTQTGGQVVVSTSYEQSGNVSLRIRDTGIGMTRNQLEQAMKPFKQVTGLPRERGDGTGLGLPLAKAMAEANRAQFAMNSRPGQGTLVEITFPSQRVLAE